MWIGLRSLQGERELSELISKVMAAREGMHWEGSKPPLLVKIAPDLTELDQEQIARVIVQHKVDGLIISNTTGKFIYFEIICFFFLKKSE